MTEKEQKAYIIYPKLGGLANDTVVQPEGGTPLYHIQSKIFAPMGKCYTISDDKMNELMQTKQDHTVLFPVHTVMEKNRQVASVGQLGFVPQNYFIELKGFPKLIPVFSSIFDLEGAKGSVAQIAQHRSKWIVAIDTDQNCAVILPLLAVIYREYSIGG